MRILEREENKPFLYLSSEGDIANIDQFFFSPTIIKFNDGSICHSKCVNCQNPPCIHFTESEINSNQFDMLLDFPYDRNKNVCALNAISIDSTTKFPKISNECFGCGLCVRRCPVGAIYIDQLASKSVITTNPDARYLLSDNGQDTNYQKTINSISNKENKFDFSILKTEYLRNLIQSIDNLNANHNNFDNLLVRNCLLQLGVPCKIRRIGDNSIRMDIFIEMDNSIGVGEIDFNQSVEGPRALLDDIAVLHSRYAINLEKIIPLIFCNQLINKRSGFYEVIYDVKKVTNIQIHTLPFMMLISLYWHNKKLHLENIQEKFILDKNKMEICTDLIEFLNGVKLHIKIFEFLQVAK